MPEQRLNTNLYKIAKELGYQPLQTTDSDGRELFMRNQELFRTGAFSNPEAPEFIRVQTLNKLNIFGEIINT